MKVGIIRSGAVGQTLGAGFAKHGHEVIDCGGITANQTLEPLCKLWCIPGFLRNQWTHAFKMLTK